MAKDKKKDVKQVKDDVKLTDDDPRRLMKDMDEEEAIEEATEDDVPQKDQDESSDQAEELKAQLLRVSADFENFKRRTQEERQDMLDAARADLALQFIPVIDNFDRATEHVPEEVEKSDWYKGFQGIQKQFDQVLESLGIARIESVGQKFDPNQHEAVSHEPNDDYDKDVVSEEFEAGYTLGDSVIRPAKVKVSSGKENT